MPDAAPLACARRDAIELLRPILSSPLRLAVMLPPALSPLEPVNTRFAATIHRNRHGDALLITAQEDCPSLTRAGIVAATAALGIDTLMVFANGVPIGGRLSRAPIWAVGDHINLLGDNPMVGRYDATLGPRFSDMSGAYSSKLLTAIHGHVTFPTCVYAACGAAQLDDMQYREWLGVLGVNVAGTGIVPELIVARQVLIKGVAFVVMPDAHCPVDGGNCRSTIWPTVERMIASALEERGASGGR